MKALFLAISLVAVSGLLTAALAQERKIQQNELPAAVQATVAKESAGAVIKGFTKEKEKGIQTYEAEMVVGGRTRDVSMDAQGNILEIEQEVSFDSLPDSVRSALTKAAGSGKITKIESFTKNGRLVAYEAQVKGGIRHREIQVGPNGEKLKHEE
ncbi:MAG TPA: hypothetical protein VEV84_08285 [Pyrinomonadaceae bacterium]|jgi:hypothetical protein|nr:hypothetical protein [Pyrinomonadaceae bacterium]